MNLSGNRLAAGFVKTVLFGCLMLAATALSAQTTNRVSLNRQTITLSDLFREIERQTSSVVVMNLSQSETGREVQFARSEGTVDEILGQALSGTGQTFRINGRYVIIIPATEKEPARQPAIAALPRTPHPPQPTQAEFERDIDRYTQNNLSGMDAPQETAVRYDTVRTERLHDGLFQYPSRRFTPMLTGQSARTPFSQDTPPLIAVKTNLVWAATLTPNLAAEIGLGYRTSLEISGGNNRWNLDGTEEDNKKLVHWTIKPEFRYWLCERFNGHFFGVHAFYSKFNVGGYDIPMLFDKEFRYEGDAYGAGISYGYHWMWNKRWGMEFTAGFGVAQMDYVKKDCEKCGSEVGRFDKTYFGPTSIGVKLIFVIK